mgnify:CR=1 FL=1
MKKELIILLTFIFTILACSSNGQQSITTTNEKITLKGTLIEKPWTKSTQSYCAQGSEYIVLKTNENKEVVLVYDESLLADLQTYKNKEIVIKGAFEEKKIVNDNPYSQKPIASTSSSFPGAEVEDDTKSS